MLNIKQEGCKYQLLDFEYEFHEVKFCVSSFVKDKMTQNFIFRDTYIFETNYFAQ